MNLSPLPIQKFFDNNGRPLNGGLLFTYAAGTNNKIATYSDESGTPNANPIVLNFRGEANVWLDQTLTYKFVLSPEGDTDPPTRPIWSVDNISAGITFASLTAQILGQILWPRTAVEIAASVTPTNYAYFTTPEIIQRLGGNGDGVTDNVTPITSAQAVSGASYFPRGTYRISTNLTLNAAYAPIFEALATLKPDAGRALTIVGQVTAGNQKILDLSNAGSSAIFQFANQSGAAFGNQVVNVRWFGAVADGDFQIGGGTDNSSAFQKAINSLSVNGGGALYVPPGIYRMGTTAVTIPDGVSVYGAGKWSTILFWDTGFSNTSGAVQITGVTGYPTSLSGLAVLGQQGGSGGNGIVSTKNGVFISNVWVSAWSSGIGVKISQTDNFLFDFACELNAIGINCTQSHTNISNGTVYGNTSAGILINNGAALEDGRVTVSNVRSSAENVAGFVVSGGKRVTFTGCSSAHTSNARYTTAGLQVDASTDVIIQGFSGFLGSTSTTAAGILVSGSTNVQISGGGNQGFRDGVSVSNSTTVNVSGGVHTGNGRYGVNIQGGGEALVSGVNTSANGSDGIMCNSTQAASKLAVIGNSSNRNTGFAITVTTTASSFINFVGNSAVANGAGGYNKTGTIANINDVGNY